MNARNINLAGGCQCGSVRFEISGQPLTTYVCHCRECQKQSTSAFGISVISVKGGALDAPIDLASAIHIWTTRKLSGVVIPDGAAQFPVEPN